MRYIEEDVQISCVTWFRLQYHELALLLYHVPNGGKRGKVEAARFKAMGVQRGVSDLCLDVARGGYHGLRIEMKKISGDSRQSEDQRKWQEAVEAQGFKYAVCRSLDEFITIVESYLGKKRKEDIHEVMRNWK